MRAPNRFAKPDRTDAEVRAGLKTFLANLDDDRLATLTVEQLAPRYRLDRRLIECTLLAAQDTRRRFLATGEIAR